MAGAKEVLSSAPHDRDVVVFCVDDIPEAENSVSASMARHGAYGTLAGSLFQLEVVSYTGSEAEEVADVVVE